MQVTKIYNSEWYRGKGPHKSKLISENGNCCLGFDGLDFGINPITLRNVPSPSRLSNYTEGNFEEKIKLFKDKWGKIASQKLINLLFKKKILYTASPIVLEKAAMVVNDHRDLNINTRIKLLRLIFKEADTVIYFYKNK